MSAVVGIVAVVIAVLGLVVAAANLGYLAILGNAARKRGISGEPIATYVRGRMPLAGGAAAAGLIALLLTSGDLVPDVLGLVLGAGSALVAKNSLDSTRARLRSS